MNEVKAKKHAIEVETKEKMIISEENRINIDALIVSAKRS